MGPSYIRGIDESLSVQNLIFVNVGILLELFSVRFRE